MKKDFDEIIAELSPEDRAVVEDYVDAQQDRYYDLGKEMGYSSAAEDYY